MLDVFWILHKRYLKKKVFIQKKTGCLQKNIRRHLFNALIQLKFDRAFAAWYPNSNKKCKKLQFLENNVYVSACNRTTESTPELYILTRLMGSQ